MGEDGEPSREALKPSEAAVDVIVPVFNEQDSLREFHLRLVNALEQLPAGERTIYYIDDGSTDKTPDILLALASEDPGVVVVELSRNFGHQLALTAGLDLAEGDVVLTLDADGQHPPELIPEMFELYQAGYEVVLTQRVEEGGTPFYKRWTSGLFYWFLNRISGTQVVSGAADFRLLSSDVVGTLREMREYHRFLRGMVAWTGYRTVVLPYTPSPRIGGSSKYSLKKMLQLSLNATFSFSLVPIYVGLGVGFLFFLMALAEVIYVLSFWITGQQDTLAPGWSSLMFMVLIVGGTLMILLGIVGVYVGFIFQQVKNRPLYVVREVREMEGVGEEVVTDG